MTTIIRGVQHRGDRIVRSVQTRDAPDNFLSAVNEGKVVSAGEIWDGTRHYTDEVQRVLGDLDTPLRAGRTLHARELQQLVDLGKTWTGSLQAALSAATTDETSTERGEREEALRRTREQAGQRPLVQDHLSRSAATTRDGIARMSKANADFWSNQGAPTGVTRDASVASSPAAINAANAKFWGNR